MSCDQKVEEIIAAGRPGNTEDVRSFLQAVAFNAKFAFDHREKSYEEATRPLRELLVKDAMFQWNKEREECYRMLQRMITNDTTLRPFNMEKKTHLVSDASPEGISASLYQVDQDGCWVPVDHCHSSGEQSSSIRT